MTAPFFAHDSDAPADEASTPMADAVAAWLDDNARRRAHEQRLACVPLDLPRGNGVSDDRMLRWVP